ncbi:MAG: orotidine-5'-phosphate decarboxylase [Candidatus Caldatribacteriota bacterium]|nr:orotidine-5'-phosphate decarboxylase [Candidatus Caldatribacteriota bacterium]
MNLSARDKLVLALDVDDLESAIKLVEKLKDYVGVFKVGSQLFTAEGPKIVQVINKSGGKVFLDLKFHDIPNTVARAAEVATKLGVYIFNVHTSGGYELMKGAAEAAKKTSLSLGIRKPIILGVTVLTSINQEILEKEVGVRRDLKEQVVRLAKLAQTAGLDGVVASSQEISQIRNACGDDFLILTPGIRPADSALNDQKRVMTPKEALKKGADFLVVGRPIRNASDPVRAAKKIVKEMEEN